MSTADTYPEPHEHYPTRPVTTRETPPKRRDTYLLAIPYTVDPDVDIPLGRLKTDARDDFIDTARIDLGLALAGEVNVTVHRGNPTTLDVTAVVVVSSEHPKHVDARRAWLERGRRARTLTDIKPRSLT